MKKKLLTLMSIIIVAGMLLYISLAVYISSQMYFDNKDLSDAAIVLGCKSYMEERISPCIYSRVGHATELYHQGLVEKLIVSGGDDMDDGANEAEVMKQVAIDDGVKAEDILLEKKATDTYENLEFSYKIAKENDLKWVIIVTELYHSPRANLLAHKMNLPYTVSPATNSECWMKYGYLSGCFLKEPVSLIVNWLEGRI